MSVLAFGDSFVKMFQHCRPSVRFFKFKGKSIKGLIKTKDQERRKIEQIISKSPKVKTILFIFGQVDFNYVRYYKVINGEAAIDESVIHEYVKWVASMNKNRKCAIVSIFPSPVQEEFIIQSLISKQTYACEQKCEDNDIKILQEHKKSESTWNLWNGYIAKYCQKYKVENIRLFEHWELNPQFRDLSSQNIHLRYVPVLKLVLKRFPGIQFDAAKAEQEEWKYEIEKKQRIEQSIERMNLREESEDTTDKQTNLKNKSSESLDGSLDNSKDIKSHQSSKLQHYQELDITTMPLRKKTEELTASDSELCTKPEIGKASESESSEHNSDSEDEGQRFFQLSMGRK